MKIIDALCDSREHIQEGKLQDKVEAFVPTPDHNISILIYSDYSNKIEVAVIDKETGEETARHVFKGLSVFSDYLCNAFTPPDCGDIHEQRGLTEPLIFEHKSRKC